MRKYANKLMGELAAELAAGLRRLRKGYVDAAEALLRLLDPGREYPYEFVVYRLTGYRGRRSDAASEPIAGSTLRSDLLRIMLDVSESARLRATAYREPAHDTASLARRFQVSTKTIQRWRRRGLPARKLVFPDGKVRIAFLESSVQWFIQDRKNQISRSMRFTQMSDAEREDILRRARRMASATDCRLGDVVKRLARRTGRAMETIRYTIRKHDRENPDDAIFPYLTPPLGDEDRETIYHRFLRGESVPALAREYRRTRGSIYRVINEVRATNLMRRPISFVDSPEFHESDAEKKILAASDAEEEDSESRRAPSGLPPYLRSLYAVPLLSPAQERSLFRRYNFLKYEADRLRKDIDPARVRTSRLKQIETLLLKADAVKNQIVRSNLRLVVSIAKRHVGGPQTLFELISDGNVSLMRAVEKFDYTKGFRFSTYASWAIMRNFARSVPKERFQLDRFTTGCDEVLEIAAGLRSYDPNEVNLSELRESIEVVLAQLLPTERSILADHYGLGEGRDPQTLEQLAGRLGLSKERVRQIEIRAIKKLRKMLSPDEIGLSL